MTWPVLDSTPLAALRIAAAPDKGAAERTESRKCGLEAEIGLAVYNEEAFRYFLEIERQRAEVSGRPFWLLLIDVESTDDPAEDANRARGVFDALATALRDTDFIGWYRTGSVVGAVLTEHGGVVAADVERAVRDRVQSSLRARARGNAPIRMQIRSFEIPDVLHDAS